MGNMSPSFPAVAPAGRRDTKSHGQRQGPHSGNHAVRRSKSGASHSRATVSGQASCPDTSSIACPPRRGRQVVARSIAARTEAVMDQISPDAPLVKFYRFFPGARAPQRADRSAAGSMPTRAFRYCEAMRTASALGWYVFPPMSFKLMWDGANDVVWNYEDNDNWYSLERRAVSEFRAAFRQRRAAGGPGLFAAIPRLVQGSGRPHALERLRGAHRARLEPAGPPARQPDPQPGLRELRGHHRDRPLVRPAVRQSEAHPPERADRVRCRTIRSCRFSRCTAASTATRSTASTSSSDIEDLTPSDWDDFHKTVSKPMSDPHRPRGEYAVQTRKRRQEEEAATMIAACHGGDICRTRSALLLTDASLQRSVAGVRESSNAARSAAAQPKRSTGDARAAAGLRRRAADRSASRSARSPARLGWLVLWMSGTLTAFIVAALSVRALSRQLNAFEMMTVRSAGGLVILFAMARAAPGLRRSVRAAPHAPAGRCATSCISARRSAGRSRSRCCRSRPCSRSNSPSRPGSRCSRCCSSASA